MPSAKTTGTMSYDAPTHSLSNFKAPRTLYMVWRSSAGSGRGHASRVAHRQLRQFGVQLARLTKTPFLTEV
jgi:hypothetical protein